MSSQSIRLAGPADILEMVPYLVGFYPGEAVVALLIRSGTVMLTMRVDMPPPDEAAGVPPTPPAIIGVASADVAVVPTEPLGDLNDDEPW